MMLQDIKQWIAVGALGFLVLIFVSRMNQTIVPDDPIILATLQIAQAQATDNANLLPTPTYTLAFAGGGGIAPASGVVAGNAPIANLAATPVSASVVATQIAPVAVTQIAPVTVTQIAPVTVTQIAPVATISPAPTQVGMVIPEDAVVMIVATAMPDLPVIPADMNGLALERFIIMDEATRANVRRIFTRGQMLGRNARSFTRIGDSTIESPHFLTRFDDKGAYNLGVYGYLEGVITYYAGSFAHESVAVKRGLHTWSVFDPLWADGQRCAPNEDVLTCELRLSNPSILLVRLGSNDAGVPDSTERNLRRLIEYCLERGVLPVMGTKADRFEGSDINNQIIRRLADEYDLPLWDFDVVAGGIPNRGLGSDGVHLTSFFAHDWTLAEAWTRGHAVHNLSALMMLDAIWRVLQGF